MCPAVGMRKPMLQHWGCSRPRGRHWQGAWVRAQLRATWGLSIYTWNLGSIYMQPGVYIYIYTCNLGSIYIHIYMQPGVYIHATWGLYTCNLGSVHVYMGVCVMYVRAQACAQVCECACARVCTCVCVHVRARVCKHVRMCMSSWRTAQLHV